MIIFYSILVYLIYIITILFIFYYIKKVEEIEELSNKEDSMCDERDNQNQSRNQSDEEGIRINPDWVEYLEKGGKIKKQRQREEDIKKGELFKSFEKYYLEHPEQRFWQALRNFSKYQFIGYSENGKDFIDLFYEEDR